MCLSGTVYTGCIYGACKHLDIMCNQYARTLFTSASCPGHMQAGELFDSMSATATLKPSTTTSGSSVQPAVCKSCPASSTTTTAAEGDTIAGTRFNHVSMTGSAASMHASVLSASQALPAGLAQLGPKERCIKGYKAQCAAVLAHLQQIIAGRKGVERSCLCAAALHLTALTSHFSTTSNLTALHLMCHMYMLVMLPGSHTKHTLAMSLPAALTTNTECHYLTDVGSTSA